MSGLEIGCARVSTTGQDPTAHRSGGTTTTDLAHLLGVGRSTVDRALGRAGGRAAPPSPAGGEMASVATT